MCHTLGESSADHGCVDGTSAIGAVAVVIGDSGDGDTTQLVRDATTGLSNKESKIPESVSVLRETYAGGAPSGDDQGSSSRGLLILGGQGNGGGGGDAQVQGFAQLQTRNNEILVSKLLSKVLSPA